jgi:hypothetical protein
MAAPHVNKVTTWMALMHSLPVNLEKFQKVSAITNNEIAIVLSGDLLLIIFYLDVKNYFSPFRGWGLTVQFKMN